MVRAVRLILFLAGICGVGYYAYAVADEYVYQNYENWTFDQQLAGGTHVTFLDYLRAKAGLTNDGTLKVEGPAVAGSSAAPHPALGETLGRVSISRLNLSAIVREGVDSGTLKTAVGHVPSTALPGQRGNFAIAAHRDTLFRALKDIRVGDVVTVQTSAGSYDYQVAGTKIVKPSDVSVLRSDGGGFVTTDSNTHLLTMITCYPFYYVGSAPKRFIVEARLLSSKPNG
ncbi:MAG TPA: class D sortase [Bryobacteraceae bacterium]|jgi:sortase A|nr:class D sortase [Bryobacteraceae bacterium]